MKPILFNTEMVRAILNGRKTVTRRVVKPHPELLIKIENGGVYYADCSGGWYCVEGNSQLTEQRLYGRDGRPYLFSDEICGIWPEGIYRVVSFEGAPGENGLSFHLNLPPEQEKDDECPQSYLRGVPRGAARLRLSKAYGRESIKQCSRESGMGNGARKLERQEAASHGDCRGETPNVKIDRCTEGGDCRLIQTGDESKENCRDLFCEPMCYLENIKIPFSVGQILYVRETWTVWNGNYEYKADVDDGYGPSCSSCILDICAGDCNSALKWRPSIHMPREAARIFLRVTDVRVERLQDITLIGAISEGVEESFMPVFNGCVALYPSQGLNEFWGTDQDQQAKKAVAEVFGSLWDSTLKKKDRAIYGWQANPWVYVIEFEKISKEEAQNGAEGGKKWTD